MEAYGKRGITFDESIVYASEVKKRFSGDNRYDEFLQTLSDYKNGTIAIRKVRSKVAKLFKGETDLILRFETNLRKLINHLKTHEPLLHGRKDKLTTIDALIYMYQVKKTLNADERYDEFINILADFQAMRIETERVVERITDLFKGEKDLKLGFNTFLPKGYEIIVFPEDEFVPRTPARL